MSSERTIGCRELTEVVTDCLEGVMPAEERARFDAHRRRARGVPGVATRRPGSRGVSVRRRITVALIACGVTAGAAVPAEIASGAAGLRVRDRLTWSHPDGTPVAFRPDLRVWCGRWERDVRVPSIHVRVGGRTAPRWELNAVVADVKRHPVVRLPHTFVFDHPTGAQFFATDGRNEVNSDTEESSGSIRFQRVSCGKRLRIAFRFSGRVGSEFGDGEPLLVRGSFSASAQSG